MDSDLETIRCQLVELTASRGPGDGRRVAAIQSALERVLRRYGLPDCGDVFVYGQADMSPRSDFIGHALLFELQAALPIRLTPPGADGTGAIRCGAIRQAKPPSELHEAWQKGKSPAGHELHGISLALSGEPLPRPAARRRPAPRRQVVAAGGSQRHLVRALGQLADVSAASRVPSGSSGTPCAARQASSSTCERTTRMCRTPRSRPWSAVGGVSLG